MKKISKESMQLLEELLGDSLDHSVLYFPDKETYVEKAMGEGDAFQGKTATSRESFLGQVAHITDGEALVQIASLSENGFWFYPESRFGEAFHKLKELL